MKDSTSYLAENQYKNKEATWTLALSSPTLSGRGWGLNKFSRSGRSPCFSACAKRATSAYSYFCQPVKLSVDINLSINTIFLYLLCERSDFILFGSVGGRHCHLSLLSTKIISWFLRIWIK